MINRLFRNRFKYRRNEKILQKRNGVALIMALTSLMFMVYIASEVTKDSAVEFIVNSKEMTRLKAYYAARNSMQIALLRVKLFQQASQLPLPEAYASQLDLIWKFPFAWPLPIASDLNSVDKETMENVTKESLMDATYTHSIEDEGSKIDLNDLASPSKTLREVTQKQILNIFEQKINSDDEFRNKYQNENFEDLVGRIYDWMSDSNTAVQGGDKRQAFSQLGQGYPPNRGFRTLEELRLVPGMNEDFYQLLAQRVTIYGMKAINPNSASKEVLLSLDPGMGEEAVAEAIARREDPDKGGPFKGKGDECLKDFKSFVESKGARLAPEFDKIPMICDKVFNFKITATGIYGSGAFALQKNIVAYVVDITKAAAQVKTFLDKEKQEENPQSPAPNPNPSPSPTPGPASSAPKQEPLPKGAPRVIYWTEY
ncbi:MAG: ral secretory pathway protein [Pseudobdellovibrio sp.]|nr:ral secretory pathway protein [Pseudobdellovibrio sp.]